MIHQSEIKIMLSEVLTNSDIAVIVMLTGLLAVSYTATAIVRSFVDAKVFCGSSKSVEFEVHP